MTLARAANRAWDREPDHWTANLIADGASLSCRDLDRTIAEMTDGEILALVTPSTAAALPTPTESVTTIRDGEAASRLGRESR